MNIVKLVEFYKNKLNNLEIQKLQEILIEHDLWFKTFDPKETDFNTMEIRRNVKTKEEIINWIFGSDPVLANGGLFNFFESIFYPR